MVITVRISGEFEWSVIYSDDTWIKLIQRNVSQKSTIHRIDSKTFHVCKHRHRINLPFKLRVTRYSPCCTYGESMLETLWTIFFDFDVQAVQKVFTQYFLQSNFRIIERCMKYHVILINCNNVKSFYSYYVYIYLQLRSWVANLQTISLLFHSPYAKKHVHIHTYCTRIRVSFERLPRFLIIVMFVTCSSLRRRERGRCFVTLGMK